MKRLLIYSFLIVFVIAFPLAYIKVLDVVIQRQEPKLSPGFEDNSFLTVYTDAGWLDSNLTEGWEVIWTIGQTNTSYGFSSNGDIGDLYATFNGKLCGISISKDINNLNTSVYRYLVIKHYESSSDSSLMFSFRLVDDKNVWHDGGWYHTSKAWTTLEVDLHRIYNGTITKLTLRLTNDFNPSYNGGEQHAYIDYVGFFKNPPLWKLSCNNDAVNGVMSSMNGTLTIKGIGNITYGTIVTAQRYSGLDINLTTYRYLKVSVKTYGSDVALRVVIWTDPSHPITVLLRTYNDTLWHNEIIDLSFFGISGSHLFLIELGWLYISKTPANIATVCYKDLSFNALIA